LKYKTNPGSWVNKLRMLTVRAKRHFLKKFCGTVCEHSTVCEYLF